MGEAFLIKSRQVEYFSYATTLNFADDKLVVPDGGNHPVIKKRYPDDFGPSSTNTHSSHLAKDVHVIDYRAYRRHYHKTMSLNSNGFEYVDISEEKSLQSSLANALEEGTLSTETAASLRQSMMGIFRTLLDNSYLWIFYIAPEGLILRKNAPACNGDCVNSDGVEVGARTVHADQDLHGEPLRSMMFGLAPYVFHPTLSPFRVMNVWIPLQEVRVRPLALLDTETLVRGRDQLRYHIANNFMDEPVLNDCWTFLYSDRHDWYWMDGQNSNTAIVFDTFSTPHGSFMVPGEFRLSQILKSFATMQHDVRTSKNGCISDESINETLSLFRKNNETHHHHAPPSLKQALRSLQSFFIHTVMHESVVVENKETVEHCFQSEQNMTFFLEQVDFYVAQNLRVSIEMRAVAFNLSHESFVHILVYGFALIVILKTLQFFIVNLVLQPDEYVRNFLLYWFKSLFQAA